MTPGILNSPGAIVVTVMGEAVTSKPHEGSREQLVKVRENVLNVPKWECSPVEFAEGVSAATIAALLTSLSQGVRCEDWLSHCWGRSPVTHSEEQPAETFFLKWQSSWSWRRLNMKAIRGGVPATINHLKCPLQLPFNSHWSCGPGSAVSSSSPAT